MSAKPDINSLLDALGVEDEQLRSLIIAMQGKEQTLQPDVDVRELHRTTLRLKESNDALYDQLELLACALGACPDCWGADADCRECGGVGVPGAFLPDEKCFRYFVVPVLRRVSSALSDTKTQPSQVRKPKGVTHDL